MSGSFTLSSGEIEATISALNITLKAVELDENIAKTYLDIVNDLKTARNKLEWLITEANRLHKKEK